MAFHDELEQFRLQVELMGVRVDQNSERMRHVLDHGDGSGATWRRHWRPTTRSTPCTSRCSSAAYTLLGREAPMASDLRFIVSVVRILSELERVGDLSLRVVKLAPQVDDLAACGAAWDIVRTLVDVAVEQYRSALRAWAAQDLALATLLVESPPGSDRSTHG